VCGHAAGRPADPLLLLLLELDSTWQLSCHGTAAAAAAGDRYLTIWHRPLLLLHPAADGMLSHLHGCACASPTQLEASLCRQWHHHLWLHLDSSLLLLLLLAVQAVAGGEQHAAA
jgi:hypothetical protein